MADQKISGLTDGGAVQATDEFVAARGSSNVKIAGSQFATPVVVLLGQSADSSTHSHTGDTSETVLATIAVPANTLGANGLIRLNIFWGRAGTAGNITGGVRWGASGSGLTGALLGTGALASILTTTDVSLNSIQELWNANATNAQRWFPQQPRVAFYNAVLSTAVGTAAVDTTAATELNITAKLANSGDTAKLLGYSAIALPHS